MNIVIYFGLMVGVAASHVMVSGQPVAAQSVTFRPTQTETCLDKVRAGNEESCVGQSARRCMRRSSGGDTTVGMNACTNAELKYWDDRLNSAYAALGKLFKERDAADLAATGVVSTYDALREMQRAWIPFRDAACEFERAPFGNGSIASTMQLSCLLDETGRQAIRLEREVSYDQ